MDKSVSSAYSSRMANSMNEYNSYMGSKNRGEISSQAGESLGQLGGAQAKLQAQTSSLINEGVAGLGVEGGAKFLSSSILKPAGEFLSSTDFSDPVDNLADLVQKGLGRNAEASRIEGQKQSLQEVSDSWDDPSAESSFNVEKQGRMGQASQDVTDAKSAITETQGNITDLNSAISDTKSSLSKSQAQFSAEQDSVNNRIYNPDDPSVSLSSKEVTSGNIEMPSRMNLGDLAPTDSSEAGISSQLGTEASLDSRYVPTAFTQANPPSQITTSTMSSTSRESVLESQQPEEESFRSLPTQGDSQSASLQDTLQGQQTQLESQQTQLESQQSQLDSSTQKLSDVSQESFADAKSAEQTTLQTQKASLDTGAEASATADIGEGAAEASAATISDVGGAALAGIGTALDFALPFAGIAMGAVAIAEGVSDAAAAKRKEASDAVEKMTIDSNTNFDEAMVSNRQDFGSQALAANLDTSKFQSGTYAHF